MLLSEKPKMKTRTASREINYIFSHHIS